MFGFTMIEPCYNEIGCPAAWAIFDDHGPDMMDHLMIWYYLPVNTFHLMILVSECCSYRSCSASLFDKAAFCIYTLRFRCLLFFGSHSRSHQGVPKTHTSHQVRLRFVTMKPTLVIYSINTYCIS